MISEDEVEYDSEFKGVNLDVVMKRAEGEYDHLKRSDTNSRGQNQWFYFKIKNKTPGTFKFNVLNFTKHGSLYQQGMKIAIFSKKKAMLAEESKLPMTNLNWQYGGPTTSHI